MIPNFRARRVLLLQGPMSPFFRRLADELREQGVESVHKINFNAGDALFFRGPEAIAFRDRPETWPEFVRATLQRLNVDGVIAFGDGRTYHQQAAIECRELGIPYYVLEEGYLRPNLITFERGGVNGHSSMSRDPDFYRSEGATLPKLPAPLGAARAFRYTGWYSTLYSIALTFGAAAYPHYRHHRPLNAFAEAYRWVLSGLRKLYYYRETARWLPRLTGELSGKFFLVALQVHCDYQLKHSPFEDVESFLRTVVASFAKHAPADNFLVLKHHPLDRAYRDYTGFLKHLAREHGLEERLVYVHDLHLPTVLKHARGSVMINSTVGLSSIHHGTPVKILGDAVYDMPGLAASRSLEEFWQDPGPIDGELYRAFRRWLMHHNQSNGSFYQRLPGATNPTGVHWYPLLDLAAEERVATPCCDGVERP